MRPCAKYSVTSVVMLASVVLCAQEFYHFHDPDLLARLSYQSSPNVQRDSPRYICVALSRDGTYRVLRDKDGNSQRLQGKLPADQFDKIRALLGSNDFLALEGTHGGLIRFLRAGKWNLCTEALRFLTLRTGA